MKPLSKILIALLALAAASPLAAEERLEVPLSDPSKAATLEVGLVQGSIHVTAGREGRVVVIADAASARRRHRDDDPCPGCPALERDDDPRSSDRSDRRGMRRITNSSYELTAEEKGNRVSVGTNSWQRSLSLRIEVPPNSALQLSTVNDGRIEVEGVHGELELHNTNGEIRVRDVRGPVSANTVNGDVEVVFSSAMAREPMAFSTLNGDVVVALPAGAAFDVRLRSDNGEIYSDFDVVLERREPKVERDASKGRYRVTVSQDLAGKVGGGGPELHLRTFNGDVVLKRRDG